jgi:FkbM family methyltransferase
MVVLDVGANLGVYTALCAKAVGDAGSVVAIEPHPGNAELLRQNIELNAFENVRLFAAAAGDHEGEAELFIHERAINHSLVRRSGKSVRVPLRTVDGIVRELGFSKVDILKIDTEGCVPAVLRGAKDVLGRLRPYVVFERDTAEESAGLGELLQSLGYLSRDVSVFTYAWPKERPALTP